MASRRAKGQDVAAYVHSLPGGGKLYREAYAALTDLERYRLARLRQAKLEKDRARTAQIKDVLEEARARQREREETIRAIFEAAPDKILAAAKSHYSVQELRQAGLSAAETRQVSAWRHGALRLARAAEWLGIPKGRLDRWVQEGLVRPSFHRRAAVGGAGTVLVRYWRIQDLEAIRQRFGEVLRKAHPVPASDGVIPLHSKMAPRRPS